MEMTTCHYGHPTSPGYDCDECLLAGLDTAAGESPPTSPPDVDSPKPPASAVGFAFACALAMSARVVCTPRRRH